MDISVEWPRLYADCNSGIRPLRCRKATSWRQTKCSTTLDMNVKLDMGLYTPTSALSAPAYFNRGVIDCCLCFRTTRAYVYPQQPNSDRHRASPLSATLHVYISLWLIFSWRDPSFLPRDAMRKRCLRCCPPSVSPSVCHVGVLYPHGWRYRQSSNFFLGPVAPAF